jgi:WD40-like Beta Propeller Repeat
MPNTPTNEHQCGACHSVSQDGSTIAFTARDKDDGPGQRSGSLIVKLTARPDTQLIAPSAPDIYDSSMMALTSGGKRVLVAYNDRLDLRSAEAVEPYKIGQVITSLTADDLGGKAGFFPEFSPNDDAVVLTLSDDADSAIAVRSGDIAALDFDMDKSRFSNLRVVVPGTPSEFHFYPTWSPDGRYIAFASAPRETGEDGFPRKSYDQKQARLRLVKREGGHVYELKNATVQEGSWSTYPKFAPWQSGTLMFLTFNSKINYGLVLDNAGMATDAQRVAQLWMSAIDVDKLPADPSSAPVWLPFQDASTPGHLGLWTKEVKCRTDLGGSGCDFGQICEAKTNTCVVVPK